MVTDEQSRIRIFVRDVKHTVNLYRSCKVTRRFIQETFFDEITHAPDYFPLPGDPEPSDAFTDFQRCMKNNGFVVVDDFREPRVTIRSAHAD